LLTATVQDLLAVVAQQFGLHLVAGGAHRAATNDDRMELVRAQVIINSARDEMATDQLFRFSGNQDTFLTSSSTPN
jgi:hypothetical protein